MLPISEIRRFANGAAAMLARRPDLAAFEVYCSSGEQVVARLNYTSDIPSRGVEEVKSLAADGFALRVVTRRNRLECASAFMAGDLSLEAVRQALERALRSTVIDPRFPGLPEHADRLGSKAETAELLKLPHLAVATAAWETLRGALGEFARQASGQIRRPGLIIGGDFTLTRERIAVASSAMPEVRTDQDAYFTSTITAIVEAMESKAASSAMGRSVSELLRAQSSLGIATVRKAFDARGAMCPPSGNYRVVLGPQPIAEILSYMVIPSLTAGAFYRADSAYHGRFGSQVMDARLGLFDDPASRHGAIRRRITCEGLPTGRTELIRNGKLIGLLSNFYEGRRLADDERAGEKLGQARPPRADFPARNGYRLSEDGGRRFDSTIRAAASNVFMTARQGGSEASLIQSVGSGVYIGKVWYTYPINGQRAGDFTCTVSGDSYLIEAGRLAAPIAPNCLRINAHIDAVFGAPVAVAARARPALVWGQPEAFYVPPLVVDQLPLFSTAD